MKTTKIPTVLILRVLLSCALRAQVKESKIRNFS